MEDRNARKADEVQPRFGPRVRPLRGAGTGGQRGDGAVDGAGRADAPCANGDGRPRGARQVGDVAIHIDRQGRWHYRGSPIDRKELVCLFASVLTRDADGEYWLETPAERGRITVEDVPFMAVEMFTDGGGRDQVVSFRTNTDEIVTLGPDNPLRVETNPATGEPAPYVTVRPGLEARVSRAVFYDMVALGLEETVEGEDIFGLWSNRTFYPMGKLDDAP
ncbi:MAG: DUF1285 domain-containing protein [Hyphomicrobiales bacterium]|nr:DUF1285 domain-containing protein [Hyphomicrobiales bacterium]MCP5371063.1 DUF1285 domain-containing protein [Hyphomicrobiales bacterium]